MASKKKTVESVPHQTKYPNCVETLGRTTAKPGSALGLPSFPMPDADGEGDCHCTFMYESHTSGRKREG